MSGLFAMGALGLVWVGIWAGFQLKHRMKDPVPEKYADQFLEPGDGWLDSVSGKDYQSWKKFGRKVSVSCTLYQRAKPHDAAVTIKGDYEIRAGSRDRSGTVTAEFEGEIYKLHLSGQKVTFESPDGELGTLNVVDGAMDSGLKWERKTSFRGPDNSAYQQVLLDDKEVYICTWGKGGNLYSPLVVGDLSEVQHPDLQRLLCLAVLWHAVLTG